MTDNIGPGIAPRSLLNNASYGSSDLLCRGWYRRDEPARHLPSSLLVSCPVISVGNVVVLGTGLVLAAFIG
jgi:hypothetical protein